MTTKRLEELRESFSGTGVLMRFSNFYQAADPEAKTNVAKKCRDEIVELFTYIDTCRASCAELITSVTTLSTALRDQAVELDCLRANAEAGKLDTARLNFILSCLNKMKLFATFVNSYHPTRSTSQQRASDEEWRISIDECGANAAMKEPQ